MSGETEKDISGWTVDTLHSHMDTQLRDLRTNLDERFAAQQDMVKTALGANERRFESVNEFRAQQKDIIGTFVTRAEYAAAHKSLTEKIDALNSRVENASGGQAATHRVIGWGFAGFGLLMTVVVFAANYIFN
jgi:hypothetical protein